MLSRLHPDRSRAIDKIASQLLAEFEIKSTQTPIKSMLQSFSDLYYFEACDSMWDFDLESGFTVYRLGHYETYINAGLPEGKDVFTLGHELGHIILGHHIKYDVRKLSYHQYRYIDAEADKFASSILMPERWVRCFTPGIVWPGRIAKLKNIFGVSWQAMIIRLDDLGIQSTKESMWMLRNRDVG